MTDGEGRYLYGIIESSKKVDFGMIGIPGGEPLVTTENFRDLAVCVSNYPAQAEVKADVGHCLAHERALETIMQGFTVIPFEFGTVAPSVADIERMLLRHRNRIKLILKKLHGRVEVGVKVFWKSFEMAAQEVVKEHTAIAHYQKEIAAKPAEGTYKDRIRIGEMVAMALDEKRKKEASGLMKVLKNVSVEVNQGATGGDTLVFNASFLIRKIDYVKFENTLQMLGRRSKGRLDFKYTGPLPPYSFAGMVLEV